MVRLTKQTAKRGVSVIGAAALLMSGAFPVAAVTPPVGSIGAAPPDTVGPEKPMRRNSPNCVETGILPASNIQAQPQPSSTLRLDEAHKFATGAGVTVAVISTGVRPQARLAGLMPGGDYVVESENGLVDCDGTGTLVAGVIGARPAPGTSRDRPDGLVGLAPDARILSIRVESAAYQPTGLDANENPNSSRQAVALRAVARAIVRAANLNAKVIVVPTAICFATNKDIDQRSMGGALAYAASKDSVVVAGAGAVGRDDGGTGGSCNSNPDPDPAHPEDPRGWNRVTHTSAPAWFDPLVLTAGATSGEGMPLENSMAGPWVDVAAPGSGLVSLSSNRGDGVVNGIKTDKGLVAFTGPEFAAAYTAATVALVRSRWPQLNAKQAAARVIATAHAPAAGVDNRTGNGLIDPVAALSASIPDMNADATPASVAELLLPPPAPRPDTTPRTVAAISTAAFAVLILAAGGVLLLRGRRPESRNRKAPR